MSSTTEPSGAHAAVFVISNEIPTEYPEVKGFDFDKQQPNNAEKKSDDKSDDKSSDSDVNWEALINSFRHTGFQATNVGKAIEKINEMLRWRLSDEPIERETDDDYRDPQVRANTKAKIFFGYTSNMISCGMRDHIRFLAKHKLVDVIVTTAGGIEEDFIKCMAPTFVGDFHFAGIDLRRRGLNRIGNLLIPNNNYCLFESWLMPLLDEMLAEQKRTANTAEPIIWSPSKIIARLGQAINNEDSVYYWCWKNNIPVYCPALTDGSLGDMIYFHSFRNPGLIVDIAQDIRSLNNHTSFEKKTGMIIIGGGVVKHHICNANLMRNGADWSVFINTGQEFDGSDSGARPDEATSWGKIRVGVEGIKVYSEATVVFPIIMAMTFVKFQRERERKKQLEEAAAKK